MAGKLSITRRIGEQVIIGEGAEAVNVEVVQVQGDTVRLAFEAPRHINIDRKELRERIQREGRRRPA